MTVHARPSTNRVTRCYFFSVPLLCVEPFSKVVRACTRTHDYTRRCTRATAHTYTKNHPSAAARVIEHGRLWDMTSLYNTSVSIAAGV